MHGSRLTPYGLRKIWRLNGITQQKVQFELLPGRFRTVELQTRELAAVKGAYDRAEKDGYEVIQYDQSLFSANRFDRSQWAPKGRPLVTQSRWSSEPVVVVCGFISTQTGKVLFEVARQNSFNGDDMAAMVLRIRKMYGTGKKIALFGDNARINRCLTVELAAS